MRSIRIAVIVFGALAYSAAHGQAVSVEYDLNVPAYTEPTDAAESEYEFSQRRSLRAGFLSRNYSNSDWRRRWSLFVGRQSLYMKPRPETPDIINHSVNSISVGHDWLLLKRSRVFISMGLSGDIFYISHKMRDPEPCEAVFCYSSPPKFCQQLSGYSKIEFPLLPKIGFVLGVRSWLFPSDREDAFPFKSGPILSLGIRMDS